MNTLYPIYLKLEQKRCVVIGGGQVALRKVEALMQAEADVLVISPEFAPGLQELAAESGIQYQCRKYQPGDLADAFLAIAATNDSAANQKIWDEADQRKIFINVVDVPSQCNFYLPSIVREGDLAIAISTNGKAPYLAKKLGLKLQEDFKLFHFNTLIQWIDTERQRIKQLFPDDIQTRKTKIKAFIDKLFEV